MAQGSQGDNRSGASCASPLEAWVGQTLDELALVEQDVIAAVFAGAEEEGNDEDEEHGSLSQRRMLIGSFVVRTKLLHFLK